MRYRLISVLGILALLISAQAVVSSQTTGTVEGQVLNMTLGGQPVAQAPVILWTVDAEGEESLLRAATDDEGLVRFDDLDTVAHSYRLQVQHQGVSYWSEVAAFPEGDVLLSMFVAVYDSTESDEDLWIERAHVILEVRSGTLSLQEMQIFVNAGAKTYSGSYATGGHTLRFSLPDGAAELQLPEDLMACCIAQAEGGFAYTMPVLPGQKEFFFSYQVPYGSASYTISKRVLYPVRSLDVLVADTGVEVTGPGLTVGAPLTIRDQTYLHLTAQDVAAGADLTLQLGRLPLEGRLPSGQTPGSPILVRAVIGAGTLATLLVLAYPFFKQRRGVET
ncbi:MAG: hypothetical protein AMJ93_07220 [Anaerolineae bacterium SM23_84]|nr:MAG: hypothetical protein AMJ93_07220 [Anaerolineae bacterium SM23_84]